MPSARYIGDTWSIDTLYAVPDGQPSAGPVDITGWTLSGRLYLPEGATPVDLAPVDCVVVDGPSGSARFTVQPAVTATIGGFGSGPTGPLVRLQAKGTSPAGVVTTMGLIGILVLDPQTAPAA